MPKQRACPHMAPFDLAPDPSGFSRATADAVGVGRREAFGVRQLPAAFFLCPNNVSVPISIFPVSLMTGHATRFHPPNRATEHTPVGCGEESPRSCQRVGGNTDGRERGRPRPHERDDRPYDRFRSPKSGHRTFTGWDAQTACLSPYRQARSCSADLGSRRLK